MHGPVGVGSDDAPPRRERVVLLMVLLILVVLLMNGRDANTFCCMAINIAVARANRIPVANGCRIMIDACCCCFTD